MIEWNKIENKKPSNGAKVLCFGKFFICVGVYDGDDFFDLLDGEYFVKNCVTHWQPLPEPPIT